MTGPRDRTKEETYRHSLEEGVQGVIDGLRAIADRIEREMRDPLEPTGVHLAEETIHAVIWGTANLNMEALPRKAARVDNAK